MNIIHMKNSTTLIQCGSHTMSSFFFFLIINVCTLKVNRQKTNLKHIAIIHVTLDLEVILTF